MNGVTLEHHLDPHWAEKGVIFGSLSELVSEYGGKFLPVGINVDADVATLTEYLRRNRLSWPQLHEDGGLDSRLAVDLGILTVPTMILVDEKGNVVD